MHMPTHVRLVSGSVLRVCVSIQSRACPVLCTASKTDTLTRRTRTSTHQPSSITRCNRGWPLRTLTWASAQVSSPREVRRQDEGITGDAGARVRVHHRWVWRVGIV